MNSIQSEEQNVAGLNFLHDLKKATSEAHIQLEKVPLSMRLMAADVTDHDVYIYIRAMREIIYYGETVIFPLLAPLVDDITDRHKLPIIDVDLAEMHDIIDATVRWPRYNFTNAVTSGEAFGFMYVMEGSTLGGKLINKHLTESSSNKGKAARFFDVYGDRTGIRWKSFIATLSLYAIQDHLQEEIIKGAVKTFISIHDYFLSIRYK